MTRKDLDQFEKLSGQLEGTYNELTQLSKKSPTDAVNKFKLGFVNSMLADANDLLGDTYVPFKEFKQFDVDAVPQNSDVVFILSQYLQCFEKWRTDRIEQDMGYWYWKIKAGSGEGGNREGNVLVRTTAPTRLKEK